MSWNDLELDCAFDDLFEIYPNNIKPAAAKKALTVALRSGESFHQIKQAVLIYSLESKGDQYQYHFNNFINDEHWKDMISYHKNADEYIRSLQDKERRAIQIIETWNATCRPHWCPCKNKEVRIPLVTHALDDEYFAKNWKKALEKAHKLFVKTYNDFDIRNKVNVTLRWFCMVDAEKHTVLRIIEGEYGNPASNNHRYPEPLKPLSEEERKEALDNFNEIMGDEPWFSEKKKPEPPKEPMNSPKNQDAKKASDLVDDVLGFQLTDL